MSGISPDAQLIIVDRLEELEATNPVLYSALRRMAYLADASRLKTDDVNEVLAAIRQCAKEATDAVDACTLAEMKRGQEIADAEVLEQMEANGYQNLSPLGKLKAIAARKRITRDERRTQASVGQQDTPTGTGVPVRTQISLTK